MSILKQFQHLKDPVMSCNFSQIFKKLQESSTQLSSKSEEFSSISSAQKENSKEQKSSTASLHDISFNAQNYDKFKHSLMKDGRIVKLTDVNYAFVDGKTQTEVIEYVRDANFSAEILTNLFIKGYRSVFTVQAYAWNLLCQGKSATIISQKLSGKTLAYIPALLTILAEFDLEEESSIGPYALIFASSSQEIEVIYKLCREFISLSKISIVTASGKWDIHEQQIKLINGCHLLITTPPCFIRLINSLEYLKVFSREKLQHLIFDNFDEICDKHNESLIEALKVCLYSSENKDKNPQIIITSTKWTDTLASIQKLAVNPTVIIGDHIEAAIYANSRFIITRKTYNEKCDYLLSHLANGEYRKIRTIVFVSNLSDLNVVQEICKKNGIEFIALSKNVKVSIDEVWMKVDGLIRLVICTDEAMIDYTIKNAQIIIHFTLPKSWTIFTKRFAVSFNYYKAYVDSSDGKQKPTAIVMMDENNILEIPRLISFLRDHRLVQGSNQISDKILKFVEDITDARERSKMEDPTPRPVPVQICSNTLKFAKCSLFKCEKRHAFINKVDKPKYLPTKGSMKISLLDVKSPNHYIIKVEEVESGKGKWISWKERNEEIENKLNELQKYMRDTCNVIYEEAVIVGKYCAYFSTKHVQWYRALVLSKEISDDLSKSSVKIYLVDKGDLVQAKSSQMMKLKSDLKLLPPLVFQLRILNLIPYDSDLRFDQRTQSEMIKYFKEPRHHGDKIVVKIALSIDDTVLSTNIFVLKHLENVKTYTIALNLKQFMLNKEYALENDKIFEELKQMAIKAKLEVPDYDEEQIIEHNENVRVQPKITTNEMASYVNLKPGTIYSVSLGTIHTPDDFFVMLNDYVANVGNLFDKFSPTKKEAAPEFYKKGTYCLYRHEENGENYFSRAMITDDEKLSVLLLDIGILKKDIDKKSLEFELPSDFLKIPFTAVKCKLIGIKPNKENWDWRSVKSFKHLLKNLSDERGYSMIVSNAISPGYYEVSLVSKVTKKDVARAAVKANYARPTLSKKDAEILATQEFEKLLQDEDALCGSMGNLFKMIGLPETAKFIVPDESPDDTKVVQKVPLKDNGNKNMETKMPKFNVSVASKPNPIIQLSPIYQRPYINWHDNSYMICLKVDAREVLEYSLKLTESSFSIFMTYPTLNKYAHIELYGSIQPKLSSHSRKNDNEIIVRLAKRVCEVEWPRLSSTIEKNNFITYREGNMPDEILEEKELKEVNLLPADYYDDESLSDYNNEYDDQLEEEEII